MLGLIWFVQVVHYPLFARVDERRFAAYEAAHQQRTTLVVAPLMLVELATALWIAAGIGELAASVPRWMALTGLALVGINWLSTGLVQVPLHRRLAHGYDARTARRLVTTNWLRTAAWTARGVIAVGMVHSYFPTL